MTNASSPPPPGNAFTAFPAVDNLEIRLLARRLRGLSEDLRLRDDEVCAILRMPPGAWPVCRGYERAWYPEVWVETRLRRLIETLEMAAAYLPYDAAEWLRAPNRAMMGAKPVDLLTREPSALLQIRDRLRMEDDR
jgi:hypothetical protein